MMTNNFFEQLYTKTLKKKYKKFFIPTISTYIKTDVFFRFFFIGEINFILNQLR